MICAAIRKPFLNITQQSFVTQKVISNNWRFNYFFSFFNSSISSKVPLKMVPHLKFCTNPYQGIRYDIQANKSTSVNFASVTSTAASPPAGSSTRHQPGHASSVWNAEPSNSTPSEFGGTSTDSTSSSTSSKRDNWRKFLQEVASYWIRLAKLLKP